MAVVTLGDVTIGYDDIGRGDPLVFVHGYPFDRSMWQPQIDAFEDRHRIVAADLRGFGQSTVLPDTMPWSAFADDIAALLDRLVIDRVVLCGLSMGGQIVMEFQRRYPDRVRGLVLADTSAAAETDQGKAGRYALSDRLLRDGIEEYAEEVLPKMVAPANIDAMPAVAKHVSTMMRSTSPVGAAAALRSRAERPDYLDLLSALPIPALVVWATRTRSPRSTSPGTWTTGSPRRAWRSSREPDICRISNAARSSTPCSAASSTACRRLTANRPGSPLSIARRAA